MAAIPYDVVDAFKAGKAKTRGHFHSTGDRLYSYAMLLVERLPDGSLKWHYESRRHPGKDGTDYGKGSSRKYSATTNAHMIAAEGALGR